MRTVRERALEWLDGLLREAGDALSRREDSGRWRRRLDAERANVRDGLAWATSAGLHGLALSVAAAEDLWLVRGNATEGLAWLQDLLGGQATYPEALRLRALMASARLAYKSGELTSRGRASPPRRASSRVSEIDASWRSWRRTSG